MNGHLAVTGVTDDVGQVDLDGERWQRVVLQRERCLAQDGFTVTMSGLSTKTKIIKKPVS